MKDETIHIYQTRENVDIVNDEHVLSLPLGVQVGRQPKGRIIRGSTSMEL